MRLDDELNNLKNDIPNCDLNPEDIYNKSHFTNTKKTFPKKLIFISLAIVSIIVISISIIIPNVTPTNYLKLASLIEEVSEERVDVKPDNYDLFIEKYNNFACKASDVILNNEKNNTIISPYSIFTNLVLLSLVSDENTKKEILDTLDMDEDLIINNYPYFYNKHNYELENSSGTEEERSYNSLWIQEGLKTKKEGINYLTNIGYCYPYYIDFSNKGNVNKCISQYIYENTKGLIYQDFDIKENISTALINIHYMNDTWEYKLNGYSVMDFIKSNNEVIKKRYLAGKYCRGIIIKEDKYSYFYNATKNNKIKYILPNENENIYDIFDSELISKVNNSTYNTISEDLKTLYYTRIIFPEYKLESDLIDMKSYLKNMGIKDLFDNNSNMSKLLMNNVCLDEIRHKFIFELNNTGNKTSSASTTTTSSLNQEYYDFILNKAFGVIVTNYNNEILYIGIVDNI